MSSSEPHSVAWGTKTEKSYITVPCTIVLFFGGQLSFEDTGEYLKVSYTSQFAAADIVVDSLFCITLTECKEEAINKGDKPSRGRGINHTNIGKNGFYMFI